MYNLIIGATSGRIGTDRLFEHTDDASRASFSDAHGPDAARLMSVPALLMPEVQNHTGEPPVARLGRITTLRRVGSDYHFTFTPSPHVGAIPLARVVELGHAFGVSDPWEWNRTHWAVKDADLFEVAHEAFAPTKLEPTAFTFPTDQPREQDLVAVMMPFTGFDDVYKTIKAAVEDAGLRCLRADDIWEQEHIMDDVISLIWRAPSSCRTLPGVTPTCSMRRGSPTRWAAPSFRLRRPCTMSPSICKGSALSTTFRTPRASPRCVPSWPQNLSRSGRPSRCDRLSRSRFTRTTRTPALGPRWGRGTTKNDP